MDIQRSARNDYAKQQLQKNADETLYLEFLPDLNGLSSVFQRASNDTYKNRPQMAHNSKSARSFRNFTPVMYIYMFIDMISISMNTIKERELKSR